MRRCKKPTIKNRLRKLRRMHGYTHKEVMQILGMKSNNRLSQWENGVRFPSLKNAIKLSILYKTLVDQLFYEIREEAIVEVKIGQKKSEEKSGIKAKDRPP